LKKKARTVQSIKVIPFQNGLSEGGNERISTKKGKLSNQRGIGEEKSLKSTGEKPGGTQDDRPRIRRGNLTAQTAGDH